jgi:acyl-coenzyme A thioesterase PaaI-like protein
MQHALHDDMADPPKNGAWHHCRRAPTVRSCWVTLALRFIAPLRFGDTIATEYTITSVDPGKRRAMAEVTCRNQRGETVAAGVNIKAFVV